jgi:hypothetical protein
VPDAPGKDGRREYLAASAIGLLSNYGREAIDPPSALRARHRLLKFLLRHG